MALLNFNTYTYKVVDGVNIDLDFYPADVCGAPVVLHIHGGSLIKGSKENDVDNLIAHYHNAGYNAVSINYRLAPETKLAEIVSDVYDAITWVKTEGTKYYSYDPDRLAVEGTSAGGYLALVTGTFKDNRPTVIGSLYGYGSILNDWCTKIHIKNAKKPPVDRELAYSVVYNGVVTQGTKARGPYSSYIKQNGMWTNEITGMDYIKDRDEIMKYCSIDMADSAYPPTFLGHGAQDPGVPCFESVQMHERLDELGVLNELVILKNYAHGFCKYNEDKEVLDTIAKMISFFDRALKR